MQEGDLLKPVDFFMRCSKLNESTKMLQVLVFWSHLEIS